MIEPRKVLVFPFGNLSKVHRNLWTKGKLQCLQAPQSHKYRECLCEYCANVDLKLKSINAIVPQNLRLLDRYQVSRLTLFPKETSSDYKKNCLDRQCSNCGTQALSRHLECALEKDKSNQAVWFQWEQAPIGQGKTRLMKIKYESTIRRSGPFLTASF